MFFFRRLFADKQNFVNFCKEVPNTLCTYATTINIFTFVANKKFLFLDLPDPDPLVIGTDPDQAPGPAPSPLRILPFSHKCVEQTACKINFLHYIFAKN